MGDVASPVRQIAYFCEDVRAAAMDHHRLFGSGPFFVLDRITLAHATYRGADSDLVPSSAYGQWGPVMVEFVQQDSAGVSPFREMFAEGETGGFGKSGLGRLHGLEGLADFLETKHIYLEPGMI